MYVINTSKHKDVTVSEKTNLKLVVDFATEAPEKAICYAILVGRKNVTYDTKNEKNVEDF